MSCSLTGPPNPVVFILFVWAIFGLSREGHTLDAADMLARNLACLRRHASLAVAGLVSASSWGIRTSQQITVPDTNCKRKTVMAQFGGMIEL